MKIKAIGIEYDLDEEDGDQAELSLPNEMIIDLGEFSLDDVTEDNSTEIADKISEKTGFCVLNFDYITIEP